MMEVRLKDLLNSFSNELCDRTFIIKYKADNELKIRFYREDLCHLLGIQHVFDRDKHYLGKKGYDKINSEELTIQNLKLHNKKGYNFIKNRTLYFGKIKEVVTEGKLLKFYEERVKKGTLIKADFALYKNEEEFIFHLFLKKENDFYSPISFIPVSVNDDESKKYIELQEKKIITDCIEVHD